MAEAQIFLPFSAVLGALEGNKLISLIARTKTNAHMGINASIATETLHTVPQHQLPNLSISCFPLWGLI